MQNIPVTFSFKQYLINLESAFKQSSVSMDVFTFSEGPYKLTGFTFSKVSADAHHTVEVVMTKTEVLVCSQPFCQQ